MTLYQIIQATWKLRNTQEAQREWECYKLYKLAHSLKIYSHLLLQERSSLR